MVVKTFSITLEQVPQLLQWMREEMHQLGVKALVASRIELVAEEAVVNVILHTWKEGKGEVEISLRVVDGKLQMAIRDWGPPYNPLLHIPIVDVDAPLVERGAGGLGIHLMRELADDLIYCRDGESNLLTFFKSLH